MNLLSDDCRTRLFLGAAPSCRWLEMVAVVLFMSLWSPAATASPALEHAIRSGDLAAAEEAIKRSSGAGATQRKWDSARVDLLAGKTTRALETLELLVNTVPDSSEYRLWYSRALLARATEASALRTPLIARKAVAEVKKSFDLDPSNGDAAIDLILVHLRIPILGGGEKAAEALANRLTRASSDSAAFARGIIAHEKEQWRVAERELVTAARSFDDPRRVLFWLGYLYQRLGRWDDAFATHQKLLELSPNDPRVWYEHARTAEFSGERIEIGQTMLRRYLRAQLPSGARPKSEARELLEKLEKTAPKER